jgi:hypothetical protein
MNARHSVWRAESRRPSLHPDDRRRGHRPAPTYGSASRDNVPTGLNRRARHLRQRHRGQQDRLHPPPPQPRCPRHRRRHLAQGCLGRQPRRPVPPLRRHQETSRGSLQPRRHLCRPDLLSAQVRGDRSAFVGAGAIGVSPHGVRSVVRRSLAAPPSGGPRDSASSLPLLQWGCVAAGQSLSDRRRPQVFDRRGQASGEGRGR